MHAEDGDTMMARAAQFDVVMTTRPGDRTAGTHSDGRADDDRCAQ
jgi:hypothetical protein